MKTLFRHQGALGASDCIRDQRAQRRGAALMVSLVAVMTIAGVGASLIQMQSAMNRRHAFSIDRRRALYIAEAGIAEAALAVSQGKSGILASAAVPAAFGGGIYWVETADLPDSRISLTCTSRVGSAEFMLRTTVIPNLNPVTSLGFFGADEVELGWGTVADGYHSGRGSFASQVDISLPVATTGDLVKIGSNGNIILDESVGTAAPPGPEPPSKGGGPGAREEGGEDPAPGPGGVSPGFKWDEAVASTAAPLAGGLGAGGSAANGSGGSGSSAPGAPGGGSLSPPPGAPTRIFGKVEPGTSGIVQSSGFSLLSGSIDPLRYPALLPTVTLPVLAEVLLGTITVTGTGASVGSHAETRIDGNLVVASGATLRLTGPKVLDLDQFVLEPGATLEFDDSLGPINIYSRGGLAFAANSTVMSLTAHDQSRGTSFTVTEFADNPRRISIQSSGEFHGTFYAPSDELRIPASLRWYGSAVARVLKTEPGARISYDRRFAIGGSGVPTLPRILSWQIVPIGEGTARRLMLDPILELRLRGVTPVASAVASPESNLVVQYIDLAGDEQTYGGPFGAFDTTSVDRIVGIRWEDPRDGVARDWLRPAGDDPTDAIANERDVVQIVRSTIRSVSGLTNVELLTKEESVDLVTSLPNEVIAASAPKIVLIDDRIGGGAVGDVKDSAATFDYDKWLEDATIKPAASDSPVAGPIIGPAPGG